MRLARIGFDRVRGSIVDVERVLAEHPDLAARANRLSAADLEAWRLEDPDLQIVDIRGPGELEVGVVPGAILMPLAQLLDRHGELDATAPVVVYCAGGYRSSIGASLLRSLGVERVADLQGGFDAWAAGGFPQESAAVSS